MNVFLPSQFFPPAEAADRRGLIGFGGELTPQWLIDAYRHGIFPWPTQDGALAWWSPDPRAVIEFDAFHVSQRLTRTMRSGRFHATCDRAFGAVMEGCATRAGSSPGDLDYALKCSPPTIETAPLRPGP